MKYLIFIGLILFLISCEKENSSSYDSIKEAFQNPPQSAKPKVYWWCLNGNIDTIRAKEEFNAMKEAGIGGFDLFEIGTRKHDKTIPGGPAFLSDESLEIIKCVVREAGKLDLQVGLNLASSWNAGGSWIKPKHGGKSLYRSLTNVKGNGQTQKIKIAFPEITFPSEHIIGETGEPLIPFDENGKPVYYEEIAILAIPASHESNKLDTSQIINLTHFFDAEDDILNWAIPEGDWEIQRFICSNSGQQLVLPSPLSAGLTIDHFDSTAVEFHLNYVIDKLKPVLGDFRKTALKSFYLASYEARGFVWTSTMVPEFKNLNGYDIDKFLPIFFNKEMFPEEINQKIDLDFKKTLSELMINNLYKKAREICNQHGLKINCEAGGPGFPLYNG
ncbi:MAG: glycosyl hydrolase, partial [Draconibacterium sp.]|nr:glycosyl hydrolase [Draconibacterium sp.]